MEADVVNGRSLDQCLGKKQAAQASLENVPRNAAVRQIGSLVVRRGAQHNHLPSLSHDD